MKPSKRLKKLNDTAALANGPSKATDPEAAESPAEERCPSRLYFRYPIPARRRTPIRFYYR